MATGNNSGMALLEILQGEQKEAREEHKNAKAAQTEARRKLLEAQQNSQAADVEVTETHARLEAVKTQVKTTIDSMSR